MVRHILIDVINRACIIIKTCYRIVLLEPSLLLTFTRRYRNNVLPVTVIANPQSLSSLLKLLLLSDWLFSEERTGIRHIVLQLRCSFSSTDRPTTCLWLVQL